MVRSPPSHLSRRLASAPHRPTGCHLKERVQIRLGGTTSAASDRPDPWARLSNTRSSLDMDLRATQGLHEFPVDRNPT